MTLRPLLLTIAALALSLPVCSQQSYDIYPVPVRQTVGSARTAFTSRVCLVAEDGVDEVTRQRARQVLEEHGCEVVVAATPQHSRSNVVLGLSSPAGLAMAEVRRLGLRTDIFHLAKYDRHLLSLTDRKGAAQVVIAGEHTDAVFYALATLEQMLDAATPTLPVATIADGADTKDRGIIEGYYGVPYTAAVTCDLFRFMARYKMNTYMYGAKSDPYHSQLWSEPYPTAITAAQQQLGYLSQDMLRQITATAHANKVNFIWAIHPGQAFTDAQSTGVLDAIMTKFESMHTLGVRQFGVFVDDVGVPSDSATLALGAERLTRLQAMIDARWNSPAAIATDTVKPLHYVPQLYAFSWVAPAQAERFFASLREVPAKVRIYITGRNVWSVPNTTDLLTVGRYLGHDTSWWWNYPCNDNDMTKLFTMDTYANFHDERHVDNLARMEAGLTGTPTIIANPMQQGEVSKLALFSVADYAWQHATFDNALSWHAAVRAIGGEVYGEALLRVLPLLRYYDGDALASMVAMYKQSVEQGHPSPHALQCTLRQTLADIHKLRSMSGAADESHRLLYDDMAPWLLKLEAMAQEVLSRLDGRTPASVPDYEHDAAFTFPVLTGLGSEIALSTQTAEPAAEVLRPFITWLREHSQERLTPYE